MPAYRPIRLDMGNSAIKLQGIQKNFFDQNVLKGVDLEIEQGQFCALIGKNGVGKSTLMRIMVQQELATRGRVYILGKSTEEDSPFFGEAIGYVSESIHYPSMVSIRSFFRYYAKAFSNWSQETFEETLGKVGLDSNHNFNTLSRGQRMQLVFAAALAQKPKILVLDEITSVLDANAREYFMALLSEFCSAGGTVVLATNIISEVQNYANQWVLLHDAEIKLNTTKDEITQKYLKLRRSNENKHPIFENSKCLQVSLNSDNSASYIIPSESVTVEVPKEIRDSRGITAEEIFIYFTRSNHL